MSDCPDCGRPFGDTARCCRSALHDLGLVDCLNTALLATKAQLAAALARAEAAERGIAAWEALSFTNSDLTIERSCCDGMHENDGRVRIHITDMVRDRTSSAGTATAAAIDLATKLGLLSPESGAKGEGGGEG